MSNETKTLIDIVHIILCRLPHIYDMMEISNRKDNLCYYYLECDISECDSMPDHIKWLNVIRQLKESLQIKSDQELLDFIKKSIQMSQELRELIQGNEFRLEFIKGLIKL